MLSLNVTYCYPQDTIIPIKKYPFFANIYTDFGLSFALNRVKAITDPGNQINASSLCFRSLTSC